MIYGFVKQSGGHIKVYSELGEGTTVKMYFPKVGDVAETEDADDPAQMTALRSGAHVLVVEDDDMVRAQVVLMVESLGYKTTEAANGQEALDYLIAHDPVDLLLTDVVMPGRLNGRQLADEASRLYPNLKVLFMSGYTENAIAHHGRLDADVHLLSKPFRGTDLAAKIRAVFGDNGSQS